MKKRFFIRKMQCKFLHFDFYIKPCSASASDSIRKKYFQALLSIQ